MVESRWALVLLLVPVLSGCMGKGSCTNNSEGQACESDGRLVYNGASNGSHSATTGCKDGSGTVHLNANLGSGTVVVTVKDASGATLYSKAANSPGQTTETKDLQGSDGTWTITARRSSSMAGIPGAGQEFSGQYEAGLEC